MIKERIDTFLKERRKRAAFRRVYIAKEAVDFEQFGEFRGEAFPLSRSKCWLDSHDAEKRIARRLRSGEIDATQAEACRFWAANGYLIIPGLIDDATLDSVWNAYERSLEDGVHGERRYANDAKTLGERVLNPHVQVPAVRSLQHHPDVLRWTELLLGRRAMPFQTIIGHAGSQQGAHSDSIHMTTYPLGFLVANWIAFEDISPDSGPLEFYPKSHKLPYLLSSEVGIAPLEFKEKGYSVYLDRYEPAIKKACETAGLSKELFLAKKGDVLFWHANLIHGGAPRIDGDASRKALVCHYFGEGSVTYHDLSGNVSHLHQNGMYEAAVF